MKIFVYGTLMSNMPNNRLLRTSVKLADAIITKCRWVMKDLGYYPALTRCTNEQPYIIGELWDVTDETLAQLDELEDYPHLYDRVEESVISSDGSEHKALLYYMRQCPTAEHVPNNDWREYVTNQQEETEQCAD